MKKRHWLKNIQDQWKEWSCTAFAMCNIINWFKEPKYKEQWLEWEAINGHDYFSLVNSKYPLDLQWPLAPSMALIFAKENWHISLYKQLNNVTYKQIIRLLQEWFLFLISIKTCDWDETKKTHICQKSNHTSWLWHAVALVDYDNDEEVFVCVNSWGQDRWDGGYFYLKYEDLGYFIDWIYAVYDSDDTGNFEKMLYKTKILSVIKTISDQWKHWTEDEKKAMNFANTMLRKVVIWQNHQYNMKKSDLINFINKYF